MAAGKPSGRLPGLYLLETQNNKPLHGYRLYFNRRPMVLNEWRRYPMKIKSILCISMLALGAGLMTPLAQVQAATYVGVQIGQPPPPRYEIVPPSRAGYVWAPGYWRWNGRRHVWVGGSWMRARPGYRYVPPRWERGPRGDWRMRPYRWDR
jgi:hypothetical protein